MRIIIIDSVLIIEGFVKDGAYPARFEPRKATCGFRERGFPNQKQSTSRHFDLPLDLID